MRSGIAFWVRQMSETLDLAELAQLLSRDAREIEKWADRGRLPGKRIGGRWRFHRAEINDWLSENVATLSATEWENVERRSLAVQPLDNPAEPLLVRSRMAVETSAVPLKAKTQPSVLSELVQIANTNWQVYDPEKVLSSLRAREDESPTTVGHGIALPHLRRPLPGSLGASLVTFGRTFSPVPFGGQGGTCDLFFLLLCQDQEEHVQVLARLARMIAHDGFVGSLRQAPSVADVLDLIEETERVLLTDE